MESGALPTLETDFNAVSDKGLLRSSRPISPNFSGRIGERVYLVDGEGNSCVAVVVRKKPGKLFYLRPDWSTWRSEEWEEPQTHVYNAQAFVVHRILQTGLGFSVQASPVLTGSALTAVVA